MSGVLWDPFVWRGAVAGEESNTTQQPESKKTVCLRTVRRYTLKEIVTHPMTEKCLPSKREGAHPWETRPRRDSSAENSTGYLIFPSQFWLGVCKPLAWWCHLSAIYSFLQRLTWGDTAQVFSLSWELQQGFLSQFSGLVLSIKLVFWSLPLSLFILLLWLAIYIINWSIKNQKYGYHRSISSLYSIGSLLRSQEILCQATAKVV